VTGVVEQLDFELPPRLEASRPPEHRGLERDGVRLLVARPGGITHARFRQLGDHLRPGDLVVVNTSPTMPAALDGWFRDRRVTVHLSTRAGVDRDTIRPRPHRAPARGTGWEVEVRRPDGTGPVRDAHAGEAVTLAAGGMVVLERPADAGTASRGVRMWRALVTLPGTTTAHLSRHGRPIGYAHGDGPFPLVDHQTVFARLPLRLDGADPLRNGASAEMASAGRPFTPLLVTRLVASGVTVAPLTLHAGVASLEDHEPPRPEPFEVPAATAHLVNETRSRGGRVVAVGTTVTRALESAADDGSVAPARGWTELVLGPERPVRIVDGLVTGWHAPRASHLLLLQAVAGHDLVSTAYAAALRAGYLWHEFGDSCLLLPD
jgi:S-adenosylmethionine:tRNA ribosyltransferase-isomerase